MVSENIVIEKMPQNYPNLKKKISRLWIIPEEKGFSEKRRFRLAIAFLAGSFLWNTVRNNPHRLSDSVSKQLMGATAMWETQWPNFYKLPFSRPLLLRSFAIAFLGVIRVEMQRETVCTPLRWQVLSTNQPLGKPPLGEEGQLEIFPSGVYSRTSGTSSWNATKA